MAAHFAEPAVAEGGRRGYRRLSDASTRAAVVGVGALGAAFVLSPGAVEDGPVVCPFRLMTGLPCPGCGLTRSWVYVAHGEWSSAWSANPFGYVSMALVAVLVVVVGVALARRTPPPSIGKALASRPFLALGAVWIAFGLGRIGWILLT